MQQFSDMLRCILDTGVWQFNSRTQKRCLFIPGHTLCYDMADGFPAISLKKLFFKAARGELFGFFRGYTSAADFRELNCKVWDGNANVTPAWLSNPERQGRDHTGRIYGSQWTDWRDWREANNEQEYQNLLALGYELRAHDPQKGVWVMRKGINQLEACLRTLMTDPSDRGILLTGWRPDEFDQACIRPCHVSYQLTCDVANKVLHLNMYQRSFDTALAFNTVLGAMYLHIFARLAGLTAGTMRHVVADAHIYESHIEGVETMLSREHLPMAELDLGNIPTLTSVDQIPGIFASLDPEQVTLRGYESHEKVEFEMAV